MRDKVKRFISILMMALMLVNLLPVGALADGITSIGYKPETVDNYNGIVYVYVKVTGNTEGLVLNKDKWYTIGTVSIPNMPDPSNYRYSSYGEHVDYVWSTEWFSNKIYASSVSGINHERNKTIPLEKVKWTGTVGDQSFGFVRVNSGATEYPNASKYTWHLDGYVDVEDVQAEYTVRYVDQDTGIVLQTAAIGKGKLGSTISPNAPDTVAYNGKDYTRQVAQTQTFKLVSPTNTFDIDYRRPYGYTVEYYYDGVKDDKKTETGSAWCKDVIEEYIDKTPDGCEHEKTENLPLTIQADESKNVIKVYYKKIGYTVTYEPGEYGTFKTQKHEAKHGDATPAFDGETTGKPGWTFAGWEPEVAKTVTGNATYTAVFVPDETKKATVLYTISLGQSDYGSIAPSAQQIILQATGKLDSDGGSVSGSTATAKTGYKFAGWYKATGEATYEKVTDDPKLTSELAESTLNRDKETGLYQNTVFEARFEPDEKQTVTVTYTAENGTVDNASDTILKVDASGLTGSTATPNPGYKFDGWYKGDERITTDLTLTPEMAKDKLDKDENGLYVNATFTAKCKLDEDQNATVLYTIFRGQSDYGSIAPAAQQIILQATGKLASGDPISGSTATANKGYKFVGWYKVTGWTTEWITEWITDKPELTPELAEQNLTRNEQGLYQNTVFAAKFELDENDQAEVIYQVENGTILNTSGSTSISQFVQVVTGEVLTDVTATPNPGYKFDGWYKGDERITTDLTLTPEMAKDKLDKDENGLYVNTTFTAKCVLDEDQNATVLCTIDKTQIGYGTVYPSIYQTILQATGKLANGDPISGSIATANPGYKFVGWYKVTGDETYEKVTDDPELTSELAESKLNRDEKTGLYRNTVFVARFELDAGAKVPVTYEAENGTLEGTTSQEAQVVTGEGLTDVTATPNKGYKFDGWYAVDKNGDKHLISGLDPAEELDAETAKKNLNKDGNLYAETTFIARFVPDTKQSAKVIYTTDGNGTLWGGPAIEKTTQHVQIVTGEVVREDGSVIGDKLTTIPTYPKDGYEFDRWIRVTPEKTIEGAGSALTDEMARPNLNQADDGLYQETEFKAIFKPQTNLSYTVNYYWNGTEIPVKPSKTVLHQTFGAEATESPIGADDYTPVSNEPKKIKIGADSTQNVINFYYYRNVKLTANSDMKTYNGEDQSVSGYTCAVAEKQQDGSVEYVPWTGEKPLIFDGISASGSGKDVNEKGYQVKFNESPIGKHDDLYYVIESQTGTLTITPRQVTLTSETASKPYDGTELTRPVVAVTGDGFVDGEVSDIKAEGTATHVSEGKMTNTITYKPVEGKFNADNYTITKKEGELWITPNTNEVVVTIEGRTKTVTYNGEEHTAWQYDVISISDPLYETAPGEFPNFWNKNAKKASGTDAGTYPMGWEAADFENTNTNFSNVTFVVTDGQLVINPRPVVLTSASDKKVYDGEALTNHTVTEMFGTESPFPNGEGLEYDFTGSQTDVGKSANTFTYKAEEGTNTKLTNYAITTEYGTLEVTPVTDRVTVKIKGRTDSVMYDGKLHFVFGFDAEPSNKLYNPNKDMWFNGTDVDMIAEGTDAGTYTMGLEVSDFKNKSDNFTNVRFEVVEDGKLEIKKRSVKLTSASDEKVYDGKPLMNETVAVGGDGFADGEGATYDFTGSQTDVGESDNLFTFEVNANTKKENYTFEVAIGTLKVNPVTDKVTVTVTEKSETVTYDGMPHTVSGYASMTADNPLYDVENDVQETPNAAWAANGTDAGEYPLGIEAGDFKNINANFTNVEFVVVDGALKIDPAPVTLQAPIASKTYDGTPLKAEDYGHSFVEGVDFADDFASISVEGSQTQAGSSVSQIKEVVPKKGKDLKNYKLTFLPGSLTIAKRSVLLTSQSATKTYDGSALTRPAVTITGDGFVPGELAKAEATGSITNVGSTPNAIQYTTTGAFNPANYSIALSVGTLTVTAKPEPEPRRTFNLTVNYVYQNGKRAAASYNRGGLKNGETFDITSPVIAGYTASETVVSGTIDNRDIKVTVIYTADGVNLDDYGVPLGLGNITMNVGDCFE